MRAEGYYFVTVECLCYSVALVKSLLQCYTEVLTFDKGMLPCSSMVGFKSLRSHLSGYGPLLIYRIAQLLLCQSDGKWVLFSGRLSIRLIET